MNKKRIEEILVKAVLKELYDQCMTDYKGVEIRGAELVFKDCDEVETKVEIKVS